MAEKSNADDDGWRTLSAAPRWMTPLIWLFDGSPLPSRLAIWKWWELRRIVYNGVLLIVGICSVGISICVGSLAVQLGDDFIQPLLYIFGIPIYGLLANLCYSLGPLFDTHFCIGRPRPVLFAIGLLFSILLTLVPAAWAVCAWIYTLVSGSKLPD